MKMKFQFCYFFLLVLMSCRTGNENSNQSTLEIVKQTIIDDHTAFVTRDVERLKTLYVQDESSIGIFDAGNAVGTVFYAKGYDQIIGTYEAYFADPTATVFPPPTLSEWNVEVIGDMAIASYKQRVMGFQVNDIRHDNGISYWMRVLKNIDGNWKTYKIMVTVAYMEAIPPVRSNY